MTITKDGTKYCGLCFNTAPIVGHRKCEEDPAGRDCQPHYEPLPRENFVFVGDKNCMLCDLPLPPRPHRFICPKHASGGWCFGAAA